MTTMTRRYADDTDFEAIHQDRLEHNAPTHDAIANQYERRTDSTYWHHDRVADMNQED